MTAVSEVCFFGRPEAVRLYSLGDVDERDAGINRQKLLLELVREKGLHGFGISRRDMRRLRITCCSA